MFRNYSHLKYSILLFLTISIGGSSCLFSQSRYTALIPDVDVAIPHQSSNHLRVQANADGVETVKSFFKFSFKNLPLATDIDTYNLKLYNLDNPDAGEYSSHAIKVLAGTNTWTGNETSLNDPKLNWAVYNNRTNKYIGSGVIKENTSELPMKLNPKAFTSISDNIASLAILSAQDRYSDFYSFATAKQSNYFSKIPKLLLEYEITQSPFRMDWAQSFSNATHTSALNWKTNTSITEAKANTLPNPAADVMLGTDPSGAIAIYQNQPIVFTQAATGNAFAIKQLDARGKILWSTPVDNMAKSWPVIDEKGRLYYFSSSNKLTVLDLNDSGKIIKEAKSLSTITQGQISAVDHNVTIGYDGTLYLSSTTDGIVALSAYPQLKLRWKFPQNSNERNGPISLSLDESKAFFINVNTRQRTSRLIVLDNMDASVLDTSEYILGAYKNDNNYYIPAPIVHKNEAVFVLNGYDDSNKLFVFDVDKGGDISLKNTIDAGNGSINTGISQPVIDNEDHVFFVYNNKLAVYDTSEKNKLTTFDGSTYLHNASILITDHSSNIYASDTYSNPKKVLGFSYSNKVFKNEFSLPINTNTKKNLALAPDGTLYTVTANNVISITPKTVSQKDITISKIDLNTNTVYRATNKITVEGFDVLSTINTILYSGGGMSFKPGFSVKKGAQLRCKTGY